YIFVVFFFFSSRRRHTRFSRDWSSDVCSSDLVFYEELHTLFFRVGGEFLEAVAVALPLRLQALLVIVTADHEHGIAPELLGQVRSEERRVGKGCRYRR